MNIRDFVTRTHREQLHIYANGTTGDDGNSGLTLASPKKTLLAAFDLIPDRVVDAVVVHLAGTFDLNGVQTYVQRNVVTDPRNYSSNNFLGHILIDGGDSVTSIGGPFTSTATESSSAYIGDSSVNWTDNEWCGSYCQFEYGGNTYTYIIIKNTQKRLYFAQNLPFTPGDGISFSVVNPATTITNTGSYAEFILIGEGMGQITLQRLNFTGSTNFSVRMINGISGQPLNASMCTADCYFVFQKATGGPRSGLRDPTTFVSNTTQYSGGIGWLSSTSAFVRQCVGFRLNASYIQNMKISNTTIDPSFTTFGSGGSIIFENCTSFLPVQDVLVGRAFVNNPSGVGLWFSNCNLRFNSSSFDISNCSGHGIEAVGSKLFLQGITGTGNSGAGLYAHSGSQITIKDGSPPTLTGTVGDIACSDPTIEDITWAEADSGIKLHISAEDTTVREVV